jgi:hypothetical protein
VVIQIRLWRRLQHSFVLHRIITRNQFMLIPPSQSLS